MGTSTTARTTATTIQNQTTPTSMGSYDLHGSVQVATACR
jgi:hypothetical protein